MLLAHENTAYFQYMTGPEEDSLLEYGYGDRVLGVGLWEGILSIYLCKAKKY